ncbi:MAG: metallophosphoesterase [Candidatus Thermoplasmatota archaeon]|nr:metallophosphoesterase [Candidatus Thermoplasmatota archaeon]
MRIAHISDLHFGKGVDFNERVYEKGIKILNKLEKDFIFVSGDLTIDGLLSDYDFAKQQLELLEGKLVIVPGNHDERNLGYKLFPEYFGEVDFVKSFGKIVLVGLASSEPDTDSGRLGRRRHEIINQAVKNNKNKIVIVGFHHHLTPVPNSGREKNIIEDAGETLDIILKSGITIVLMGHRHVPYATRVHKSLLINAGTFSCNRTRAHFGYTFNILDIVEEKDGVSVILTVVNIREERKTEMVKLNLTKGIYENKYCE